MVLNRSVSTHHGYTPGLNRGNRIKHKVISFSLILSVWVWLHTFLVAAQGLRVSNQLVSGSWLCSSRSLKVLWALPSPSLPSLTPMIKVSVQLLPGRSLSMHLAPQLLWLPLKGLASKSPSLESQKGLALTSPHSLQKTSRQFPTDVWALPAIVSPGLSQREQAKTQVSVFTWKGFKYTLF